jgi:hypothetical protein
MNPNFSTLLMLMALMGDRDRDDRHRDDRFLQTLAVVGLLGGFTTTQATGIPSSAPTICPPASQCDLLLLAMTLGGGGGLLGRRGRDRDESIPGGGGSDRK